MILLEMSNIPVISFNPFLEFNKIVFKLPLTPTLAERESILV